MASDIASRIKARLSRRRHSTTPSLASSQSGLGEASASSAPSQSSREASFASHAQLTASQTSDEQAEAIGHGAAAGPTRETSEANETKKLHVNKRQQRPGHSVGHEGDGEHRGPLSPAARATSDQDHKQGRSEPTNAGNAPGGAADKKPLEGPLGGSPEAAETSSPQQQIQGRLLSQPPAPRPHAQGSLSFMGNIDEDTDSAHMQDPPRQAVVHTQHEPEPGHAGLSSRSRLHPHPPQQLVNPAPHLPPASRSIPSPASSPARASHSSPPTSVDRSSPQRGAGRTHNLRLSDLTPSSSSGAKPSASGLPPPTYGGDDLEVDPLQRPPQHGREPDQLSFASSSAVASASATSSADSPASFVTAEPQSPRRQSLFASRQTSLIKTLLRSNQPQGAADTEHRHSIDTNMVTRKIWVRRPNASATTITINEEDLVDDVRDMILRKYANSLGRTFDAPDLVIRIHPRDQEKERVLGPEEVMARTLDTYYSGGQTVDEALTIDIPRRTPKASPRVQMPPGTTTTTYYITDDGRPSEAGEGYFPPVMTVPSPHAAHAVPVTAPNGTVSHSIAVIGTGHIPPIPSPGGTRSRLYRERPDRPRLNRTHTSSPTLLAGHTPGPQTSGTSNHGTQNFVPRMPHSRTHSSSSDHPSGLPTVKTPMAKSPGPDPTPARVATPPPRTSSPRAPSARLRRSKKSSEYSKPVNVLNGSVPPINVLIVEDNPINLKLLEAFVKRLKVRWQTAMNGKDAVKKWRTGGFHLVLMDIQLPVMNGLDATREIRRLERVNSIGVFTSAPCSSTGNDEDDINEQDRLQNLSLFKSPVIIVALTASSLQSDRHEALAAGCNDFLTKVCSIRRFRCLILVNNY